MRTASCSLTIFEQALSWPIKKARYKGRAGYAWESSCFGDETAKGRWPRDRPRWPGDPLLLRGRCTEVHCWKQVNPRLSDNQDNIRGILYIKDLLPHLPQTDEFQMAEFDSSTLFRSETKKIDDLLRDFSRKQGTHAVVGCSGMRESWHWWHSRGDCRQINTNMMKSKQRYTRLGVNTYIFEGKDTAERFLAKHLFSPDDEFDDIGDADTLAGLLLEIKGGGDFLRYMRYWLTRERSSRALAIDEQTSKGKWRPVMRIKKVMRAERCTSDFCLR